MKLQDQLFRSLLPYLAIVLASVVVWGHSLGFQFVWDDRQFIQELESIRSFKNVPAMFYRLDAQSSYPEGFKLFRPLRTVHYALLYWVGGKDAPQPWLFHLANLVWHTVAALLLFSVSWRLLKEFAPTVASYRREDTEHFLKPQKAPSGSTTTWVRQQLDRTRWLALWIALAFAVHPLTSEVVCWAKSLDDTMATVFTLAAFRALLKWDGSTHKWIWAVVWFVLAIYSKVSAVPFVAVTFVVLLYVLRVPFWRSCRLTSAFAAAAALFMVNRHYVMGQSTQTEPISGTYMQTIVDTVAIFSKYLRLACGVPPFCIDYSWMTGNHPLWSVVVLGNAAVLIGLAGLSYWLLRRRQTCLAGIGLLWFGLFLLPVSNVLPMMQYMAERFLYLPLIGFLWVAAVLVNRFLRAQLALPLGAAALVAWSLIAWDRSWIWKDEVTLFVQSSRSGPKTARVDENAVAAIFSLPHIKEMFEFDKPQKTLRVKGPIPSESREAIEQTLVEARIYFPDDATLASGLGVFYAMSGRPADALPLFRLAVQRRPNDARLWTNLGQALLETQSWADAEQALTRALEFAPDNVDALRSVSRLHWQRQKYAAAAGILRRLQQLEPANPEYARWIQQAEKLGNP